jgi:hypothetical protein
MHSEVYATGDQLQLVRHYADSRDVEYWPGGVALVVKVDGNVMVVRRWRPGGGGRWTTGTYNVSPRWGWTRKRSKVDVS